MSVDDVVVTGLGVVSPLGADAGGTWSNVLAGRTAARHWPDLAAEGYPVAWACRADVGEVEAGSRGGELARRALAEAVADAGLDVGRPTPPERVGVYVGSTMGESGAYEAAVDEHRGRLDLDAAAPYAFARHLGEMLGATGPRVAYGTACAAGNYAIGAAARAIRAGRVDVAVAGGVEPFSRIALLGFARMRAMAPDVCRPFAKGRRGMQLGEGAALLVLESAASARARGVRPRAVVGELGLAADAAHPTAPLPDGSGMAASMLAALAATGVAPGDVGWVCAHGTGTERSDAAEARALQRVFGEGAVPPVSSLKGAIGHSLGAATAIEAALAVLALEQRLVPPSVGLDVIDPDLAIDVPTTVREMPAGTWVLSSGFAFGGLDSAILIGGAR